MLLGRETQSFVVAYEPARLADTPGVDGPKAAPIEFPPHVQPPDGAEMLFLSGSLDLAGAGVSDLIAAFRRQLPAGRVGVLKTLNLVIEPAATTTVVLFQLLVNGGPVAGLNALQIIGRAAASLALGLDVRVDLPQGALVEARATTVDGAAVRASMQATGWHYAPKGGAR